MYNNTFLYDLDIVPRQWAEIYGTYVRAFFSKADRRAAMIRRYANDTDRKVRTSRHILIVAINDLALGEGWKPTVPLHNYSQMHVRNSNCAVFRCRQTRAHPICIERA